MERNGSIQTLWNDSVLVFSLEKKIETDWFRTRVRFEKNEERNGRILVQLTSFVLMVNIPPAFNKITIKKMAALCLYFQQ
jgi:hypothetical protein